MTQMKTFKVLKAYTNSGVAPARLNTVEEVLGDNCHKCF